MNKNANSNTQTNETKTKQRQYFEQKPNHLCNSCIKSSKCARRIQFGLVFGEIHSCIDYKNNGFKL